MHWMIKLTPDLHCPMKISSLTNWFVNILNSTNTNTHPPCCKQVCWLCGFVDITYFLFWLVQNYNDPKFSMRFYVFWWMEQFNSHNVCNMGVIFNSQISLSSHATIVTKSCFYHVRALCKIRKFLGQNLQRVQNRLCCNATRSSWFSNITIT